MKYSFAFAALVAAVQAQSLGDVPKCAIPCLDKAIASESSCDTTDLACVCKNFDDIRSAATSCVIDECGSDVAISEVLPATEKLCKDPPKESAGEATSKAATSVKVVTTVPVETTLPVETTVAVETTLAVETTIIPPIIPTTTAAAPVVSTPSTPSGTPSGTPSPSETKTGGSGSEPAPTNVGENSAAGVKGLGAIAMVALAALAL
ncbi:hypothetical protein ACHAPU_001339 [Fusarium lateritium]